MVEAASTIMRGEDPKEPATDWEKRMMAGVWNTMGIGGGLIQVRYSLCLSLSIHLSISLSPSLYPSIYLSDRDTEEDVTLTLQ